MERNDINVLLTRYNGGNASEEDLELIESLLEKGVINLDDLNDVRQLDQKLRFAPVPEPSTSLDDRFYATLALEKKAIRRFSWNELFNFEGFLPRLAFGVITFALGLAAGYLLLSRPQNNSGSEIQALTSEVNGLKEMMMLSLLEKESATDRLKAVSLTGEFSNASEEVTRALLKTLTMDDNVNVRLAALDALRPYASNSTVRAELIRAIAKQDSPLVQIALAELMAALQEKSSVKEFEKLLQDDRTPSEVKKRIKEKIEILI